MYSRLPRCFSCSHGNPIKARVPNFPTAILPRQGYPAFPLQSYQGKGTQLSHCNPTKARVPSFPTAILPRHGYPAFPLQSYQGKGTQLSHEGYQPQRHNLTSARTQSKSFTHQSLYISKIDKFSFRPKMLNLLHGTVTSIIGVCATFHTRSRCRCRSRSRFE